MTGSRRRERAVTLMVVLALTLWVYQHFLAHLMTWSQSTGGEEGLFVFWLGHLPWAVAHGHNPFFTGEVNVPGGMNAMWNTSVLTFAVLMTPVTLLGGVILSYNLSAIITLFLTGIACTAACRRFVSWWPAALLGGIVAGFSPYVLGQALGHLHLVGAIPPLLILIGHELLVRQRAKALVLGLLLGALVTLQFGLSTEVLASTAVVAVIGVVVLALQHRSLVTRDRLRWALRPFVIAVGFASLAVALPLYELLAGPQHLSGPPQNADRFSADLLSPVLPTRLRLIAPRAITDVTDRFSGNLFENTAYVGIPLLILMTVLAVWLRRNPVARWASAMFAISLVLSLGRELRVNGHATGFPLPFDVLANTPLLSGGAAVRYSYFTMIFAGLLLALGVDAAAASVRVRGWSWRPALAAAGLAVALIPLLPSPTFIPIRAVPIDEPAWFTGDGVKQVPDGSVVLVFPYLSRFNSEPMTWQALAHFRFRQLGTYGFTPDPRKNGAGRFDVPTVLAYVETEMSRGREVPLESKPAHDAIGDLIGHQVQTIAVVQDQPGADLAQRFYTGLLGRAPVILGGVAAWYDVPAILAALPTQAQ